MGGWWDVMALVKSGITFMFEPYIKASVQKMVLPYLQKSSVRRPYIRIQSHYCCFSQLIRTGYLALSVPLPPYGDQL